MEIHSLGLVPCGSSSPIAHFQAIIYVDQQGHPTSEETLRVSDILGDLDNGRE